MTNSIFQTAALGAAFVIAIASFGSLTTSECAAAELSKELKVRLKIETRRDKKQAFILTNSGPDQGLAIAFGKETLVAKRGLSETSTVCAGGTGAGLPCFIDADCAVFGGGTCSGQETTAEFDIDLFFKKNMVLDGSAQIVKNEPLGQVDSVSTFQKGSISMVSTLSTSIDDPTDTDSCTGTFLATTTIAPRQSVMSGTFDRCLNTFTTIDGTGDLTAADMADFDVSGLQTAVRIASSKLMTQARFVPNPTTVQQGPGFWGCVATCAFAGGLSAWCISGAVDGVGLTCCGPAIPLVIDWIDCLDRAKSGDFNPGPGS